MRALSLNLATVAAIHLAVSGCGARLKSADAVSSNFASAKSLGDKVGALCTTLRERKKPPYLADIDLADDACTRAGQQAQDVKTLVAKNENIGFSAIRSDGEKFSTSTTGLGGEQTQRLQTRVELWLNRSILGIVRLLLPMLKDKSKGGLLGDSAAQDDEEFKIKVIGEPEFDAKEFKFAATIELTSRKEDNGQVDISNRVKVTAQLFDKQYGAATVETTEDTPKEKSFIKSAKVLLLMVPHDQDIYLDIVTDITLHSFGVNEAVKNQFLTTLSKSFMQIPNLIDEAERNANAQSLRGAGR